MDQVHEDVGEQVAHDHIVVGVVGLGESISIAGFAFELIILEGGDGEGVEGNFQHPIALVPKMADIGLVELPGLPVALEEQPQTEDS